MELTFEYGTTFIVTISVTGGGVLIGVLWVLYVFLTESHCGKRYLQPSQTPSDFPSPTPRDPELHKCCHACFRRFTNHHQIGNRTKNTIRNRTICFPSICATACLRASYSSHISEALFRPCNHPSSRAIAIISAILGEPEGVIRIVRATESSSESSTMSVKAPTTDQNFTGYNTS